MAQTTVLETDQIRYFNSSQMKMCVSGLHFSEHQVSKE